MKKTAAVLCAAMFALSACGGDDSSSGGGGGSSEEAQAKENIKASVLEESTEVVGETTLTEEQAGCFADGLVDEVGIEKLQEYQLIDENYEMLQDAEPSDMTAEDAEATAAVITDCVDMTALIEEQINESAGSELTEEQASCITDAIDEEAIEAGLAAEFQGTEGSNPLEESMGDLMGCVMGGTGEMELQ